MTNAETEAVQDLARLSDIITPMALRVTATLRLVDHIRGGATTSTALAEATGAHPDALWRLVRHLIAVGVLTDAGGRLAPTEVGALLAEDHPAQQRDWLDLNQAVGYSDAAFAQLHDAVATGRPMFEKTFGRSFWEELSADPARAASFDSLMATNSEGAFEAPAAAYDWTGVRHVVDVGGGTGGMLLAIADVAPHIRGTLVELPGPAEEARKRIASAGLADRLDVADGSFFDELPVRADIVTLSFVLHNWADDDAARILRRCREALEPGGRILMMERADPAQDAPDPVFTSLDIRMLVMLGGRERTLDEWTALASAADLVIESVSPLVYTNVPFDFSSSLLVLAARS